LQGKIVGEMPFSHLGIPDINHFPNSFGAPILTKTTLIGGIGIADKNNNVFKPDPRTENLVKRLLRIDNKSKPPFNTMALRLNSNITNENRNLYSNHTQSNLTEQEKDGEEDEEHIKKEFDHSIDPKLNNFNSNGNNNSNNNLNNPHYDSMLTNKNNLNINLAGKFNSNNIGNPNLNKNLPFRTNPNNNLDKKLNDKHQGEIEEEDDDDENDEDEAFSIKGKSSDFDDMLVENDRSDENLFLQNKELLKIKKTRKKFNSSIKNLNSNKKRSNYIKKTNIPLLTSNYHNDHLNNVRKESDLLFDDKVYNLYIEKKKFEKESNKKDDLYNFLNKDEISQEDFLKTVNNYDYLKNEPKYSSNYKKGNAKNNKDLSFDDEFKLQKELYEMQHNQTLIEEIKKGN